MYDLQPVPVIFFIRRLYRCRNLFLSPVDTDGPKLCTVIFCRYHDRKSIPFLKGQVRSRSFFFYPRFFFLPSLTGRPKCDPLFRDIFCHRRIGSPAPDYLRLLLCPDPVRDPPGLPSQHKEHGVQQQDQVVTKPVKDHTAIEKRHPVFPLCKAENGRSRQKDQNAVGDQIPAGSRLFPPPVLVCHLKLLPVDPDGFQQHRPCQVRRQDRVYDVAPPGAPDIGAKILHGKPGQQMGRKPEQHQFPESAFYQLDVKQSKQHRRQQKDQPAQKGPPVQPGIEIRDSCRKRQLPRKDRIGILNALDHAPGPADPLPDHTSCGSRGQPGSQHLRRRIGAVPRFLKPQAGFKVLRHRPVGKSSDLLQGFPQDYRVAAGVRHSVRRISQKIDLPGEKVLFIGDSFFRVQIKLKKILIVKTLGRLQKAQFPFRDQKIRNGPHKKGPPGDHIRVKSCHQR